MLGDSFYKPGMTGERPCTNQPIITKISYYYEIAAKNPSQLNGPIGQVVQEEEPGHTVVTLKLGQACGVPIYEQDDARNVSIRAVRRTKGSTVDGEGAKPVDEPFMMNGKQVTPFMEVGFR